MACALFSRHSALSRASALLSVKQAGVIVAVAAPLPAGHADRTGDREPEQGLEPVVPERSADERPAECASDRRGHREPWHCECLRPGEDLVLVAAPLAAKGNEEAIRKN